MAIVTKTFIDKKLEGKGIYHCEIEIITTKSSRKEMIVCSRPSVQKDIEKFKEKFTNDELGINPKSVLPQTISIHVRAVTYLGDATKIALEEC